MIGANSTIGGNAFITESIPSNTRVSVKTPELRMKETDPEKQGNGKKNLFEWTCE